LGADFSFPAKFHVWSLGLRTTFYYAILTEFIKTLKMHFLFFAVKFLCLLVCFSLAEKNNWLIGNMFDLQICQLNRAYILTQRKIKSYFNVVESDQSACVASKEWNPTEHFFLDMRGYSSWSLLQLRVDTNKQSTRNHK